MHVSWITNYNELVFCKLQTITVFLKLNLAFLSESFWDWANEIWTVRSIERSQNIWFLGILTLKFKKFSQALTRLHITIKIINSIDQIDIFTHFML